MTTAQANKIKELLPVLRAVRKRCLDCSAYNSNEVKLCTIKTCPLFPYRFGKVIPKRKSLCKKFKTQQKTLSEMEEGNE